jgi:hypothetical protein
LFVVRLAKALPNRDQALQALAEWAIKPSRPAQAGKSADSLTLSEPPSSTKPAVKARKYADGVLVWRAPGEAGGEARGPGARAGATPTVAAAGAYVFFSPDAALVDLALDTLGRRHPSAADQMPDSGTTLALLTPRTLAEMTEKEALASLAGPGDASLRAAAQTLLPPRMRALAKYPALRLVLPDKPQNGWQPAEWRALRPRP